MTAVNMLEQMASGLIEEKEVKGRGLTPLVSERLKTPASFPNDLPEDAIRGIIVDLVRQHTAIGEVIDALSLMIGADPRPGPVALVDQVKQKERAADARVAAAEDHLIHPTAAEPVPQDDAQEEFEERLEAQTAAAQAATFTPEPAGEASSVTEGETQTDGPPLAPAPSGWACPNGHDTVEAKVSPRGRAFSRCTTCGAFEK